MAKPIDVNVIKIINGVRVIGVTFSGNILGTGLAQESGGNLDTMVTQLGNIYTLAGTLATEATADLTRIATQAGVTELGNILSEIQTTNTKLGGTLKTSGTGGSGGGGYSGPFPVYSGPFNGTVTVANMYSGGGSGGGAVFSGPFPVFSGPFPVYSGGATAAQMTALMYGTTITYPSVYYSGGVYYATTAAMTFSGANYNVNFGSEVDNKYCTYFDSTAAISVTVGAPSATASNEPQSLVSLVSEIDGTDGISLILVDVGGLKYTFLTADGSAASLVSVIEGLGGVCVEFSPGVKSIPSVFPSAGAGVSYGAINTALLATNGVTLWGGDGCGGERVIPATVGLNDLKTLLMAIEAKPDPTPFSGPFNGTVTVANMYSGGGSGSGPVFSGPFPVYSGTPGTINSTGYAIFYSAGSFPTSFSAGGPLTINLFSAFGSNPAIEWSLVCRGPANIQFQDSGDGSTYTARDFLSSEQSRFKYPVQLKSFKIWCAAASGLSFRAYPKV